MRRLRWVLAAALVAVWLDCADSTGPDDLGNNGGTGNQSLAVYGDVDVDPRPGGFLSRFQVVLEDRDDLPVSEASVVIEGNFQPITLEETATAGTYYGELTGAASGALGLSVEKDGMYVRDVRLGNIGIHAILEPEIHDTVPANVPLMVRWVSDREAPFARLSTRDHGFDVLDNGEFVIPAADNDPRSNQRFELLRWNEVQIAGGLRSSYFKMEVRGAVDSVAVLSGG
jgi:hypothetical protein